MQAIKNAARALLTARASPTIVQAAQLKMLPLPKAHKDIEYPERMRLKVVDRTPKYPPNIRLFKMQKRLRYMRGPEVVHNTLLYKQYGVIATSGGRLRYGHFEMIRLTLGRYLKPNMFGVWRVDAPWQPVSKKSQGQRMGGGKGSIDHYVTPVKAGRVIVEVAGEIEFFEVEKALKQIANQLPFKAMAVSQEILDKMAEKEKQLEENNLNPWTWKYLIQNNLLGCQNWIRPTDKFWFNKYL